MRPEKRITTGAAVLSALLFLPTVAPGAFAIPGPGAIDGVQELPPGVTAEKIATGEALFQSEGCATCHNPDGKGKPGMTSDLTDDEWKFAEGGTFESLQAVLKSGLGPDKTGGMPMPAASTRNLSDAQIEALAAYAWSLGRTGG